jgi:hypothetical protein
MSERNSKVHLVSSLTHWQTTANRKDVQFLIYGIQLNRMVISFLVAAAQKLTLALFPKFGELRGPGSFGLGLGSLGLELGCAQ